MEDLPLTENDSLLDDPVLEASIEEFVPFALERLEVLPRDVFFYLTGYLDEETAVALCRVNKEFYNHICGSRMWRDKLIQKYNVTGEYIDHVKGNNTYYGLYKYLLKPVTAKVKNSFKSPSLITEDMLNFLRDPETDFGLSNPDDPTSPPLKNLLMATNNGIITRIIFMPLFNIYAYVNNMQKDPNNRTILTSTDAMDRHLQATYELLAARPQKYTRDGQPIPNFDPKLFRYAGLQSIIVENMVNKDKLSSYHQNLFRDPGLSKLLTHDQNLVSKALSIHRIRKEQGLPK